MRQALTGLAIFFVRLSLTGVGINTVASSIIPEYWPSPLWGTISGIVLAFILDGIILSLVAAISVDQTNSQTNTEG